MPVPVLTEEQLRKLVQACEGKDWDDRRDMAVIRLFLDSGMRLSELANLKVGDVDLDARVAIVLGKGRRPRACPFGAKTAGALDRWMHLRARDPTGRDHRRAVVGSAGADGHRRDPLAHRTAGQARPASATSTPTCSATPSRTGGWPTAATRPTSCAWWAGVPGRCYPATGRQRPTSGPGRPIRAAARAIGCERTRRVLLSRAERAGIEDHRYLLGTREVVRVRYISDFSDLV